ncbi:MAG: hypothetical protein LQ342_004232 [Letrouitia transgressa]|nr:MAG: hypothetical protein LQ342_004232 [Letrouitia transgressa]
MSNLTFGLLALPENALAISRISRAIAGRIRVYRDAPKVLENLQKFGIELYKGQFFLDVKIAQVFAEDSQEEVLTNQLNDQLRRPKGGLDDTQKIIKKAYNNRGEINRAYFTMSVQQRLSRHFKEMRSFQEEFYNLISSLDVLQRWKKSTDLTWRTFEPSVLNGEYCVPVSQAPYAYTGRAVWKDVHGKRHYLKVLFERHELEARDREKVLHTLVYLAAHLPRSPSSNPGIQRCLGYRDGTVPELVFEIPAAYPRPETLCNILNRASSHTLDGCPYKREAS